MLGMMICIGYYDFYPILMGEFVDQKTKWIKGKSLYRPHISQKKQFNNNSAFYPKRADRAKKGPNRRLAN